MPERTPGYWEHFPERVTARLVGASHQAPAAFQHGLRYWALGFATAFVLLVLGAALWIGKRTPADRLARDERLYREIAAMFPNRVRAIIVDERGVQLELSEKADMPSSPPLRVNVCANQQCRTFITFSGQQVRVDGEKFDVLADANGNVLVVGRNFVWKSAEPAGRAGVYRIEAQPLGITL